VFAPGLLFHVIMRGNQRRNTFLGGDDYKAHIDQLEKYRIQFRVKIYAYCLALNHLHQLLDTSGTAPLVRKGVEAAALLVRNHG
jgi:putative transposase